MESVVDNQTAHPQGNERLREESRQVFGPEELDLSSPAVPTRRDRQEMEILIVDDEEASTTLLEAILRRGGYEQLTILHDPRKVSATFAGSQPDLLLLDLHMPYLNGPDILTQLQPLTAGSYFPVLMLTADENPKMWQQALAKGAKDLLTKPFDGTEVKLRVANLLEARSFHLQLQRQNERFERLLALLALAFVFAYRVGEWLAERTPIRFKRHGRKERSVFHLGLDHLAEVLLNLPYKRDEFTRCLRTLSRT